MERQGRCLTVFARDRSFVRLPRSTLEIEQAILLIRATLHLSNSENTSSRDKDTSFEIQSNPSSNAPNIKSESPTLSETIIRALVSVAENQDEPSQGICIETLAELALLDIRCLIDSDAYRVLLQAVERNDGSAGLGVCGVLLALFDSPMTREELPCPSGLEVVMSSFTEAYGSGAVHLEKLRNGSINVYQMLRSWSGIFSCCSSDRQGIACLVDALRVPVTEMREVLLDLLFCIFRIEVPDWFQPLLDIPNVKPRRRLKSPTVSPTEETFRRPSEQAQHKLDFIDQYVSIVLALFVECGLIEVSLLLLARLCYRLIRSITTGLGRLGRGGSI